MYQGALLIRSRFGRIGRRTRIAGTAVLMTALLLGSPIYAQWQELEFDDSDMALDLTEALTFQKYPTYDQYVEIMRKFASDYSHICRLDTFGTSVEGRLLLALKISDHPGEEEAEAGFFYTSSMHGNEVVGMVLLLRLANQLLEGYGSDTEITRLVEGLEIRINPVANPDGSYSADNGESLTHAIRNNVDGTDLNRNFPAPAIGEPDDTTGRALENRFMMTYLQQHRFTMSANIHSGAEVVNYPWDHTLELHADDAWYRLISHEYADEAMAVDPDYMFGWPDNGITNGATWYPVQTGRQDYVNWYLEGREVTLELSNEKLLSSDYLDQFWNKNKRSLLNYMSQCMYGIRGMVTDEESGEAVRALIHVLDHDSTYSEVHSSADHGDFYRLIKEGIYDLKASAPGYISDTLLDIVVTDYQATVVQIALVKDPKTGIEPSGGEFELRLYPNPAHERIYIGGSDSGSGLSGSGLSGSGLVGSFQGGSVQPGSVQPGSRDFFRDLFRDQVQIRVYSSHGVMVIQQDLPFAQFPLPLSIASLQKGYYILKISCGGFNKSMGFVKQ